MAKVKKTEPKKKVTTSQYTHKKKGRYDITVKPPEGASFEELMKMAVNTPPVKKKK